MKLSTKGRYAVMALYDLAREAQTCQENKAVSLQDIALRQNLSLSYLEQLFARMRRAGLVESLRGAQGGYVLGQDPKSITVSMIMRAANESFKSTRCSSTAQSGCMNKGATCATHHLWAGLEQTVDSYLNSVTLADLLQKDTVLRACGVVHGH